MEKLLRSHNEDGNTAKRSKIENKSSLKEMRMVTEAITSTEETKKAKTAKPKLPTEETKNTTTTVQEAKERVPPLSF